MLTENQAQNLINKFIELRDMESKTPEQEKEFRKHERICVENFKYLINMRTNKYKKFSNHKDLEQDGMEALLNAMRTYKSEKGIFFYWAHKYISTKVSRAANTHTTIRYPLKVAKEMVPKKESTIPENVSDEFSPDKLMEAKDLRDKAIKAYKNLPKDQRDIVTLTYGFGDDEDVPVHMICQFKGINRVSYNRSLDLALKKIKESIK